MVRKVEVEEVPRPFGHHGAHVADRLLLLLVTYLKLVDFRFTVNLNSEMQDA